MFFCILPDKKVTTSPWQVQYLNKEKRTTLCWHGEFFLFKECGITLDRSSWKLLNLSRQALLNFTSLFSDKDFFVFLAWQSCVQLLSFVYITVIVTLSPYRLWHHDRRLHNVHQCLNMYSQLSTDQPSNYIWPSKSTGLLKLPMSYWNVKEGLQTAIFLIINLHSLPCLFPNPVSSFCKLLEQKIDARGCAFYYFLNKASFWNQRSIVNL
jgi:hypothetical protein